jgi:hypothetical protein
MAGKTAASSDYSPKKFRWVAVNSSPSGVVVVKPPPATELDTSASARFESCLGDHTATRTSPAATPS